MKASLLSAALAASLGAGFVATTSARGEDGAPKPATTQAAVPVNKFCPVQGDPIDPKVTVLWNGKLIGFCCRDCVDDFKKEPEKYTRNLK